jgi:hypothetical protein
MFRCTEGVWPATIQHFLAVQAGNQGLSCSWAKTESHDYLSLEPAIYRAKRFSFIDLTILLHPTTVSFYATAAPRTPEYTYTEGNGDAFSRAEGRIILCPRILGV